MFFFRFTRVGCVLLPMQTNLLSEKRTSTASSINLRNRSPDLVHSAHFLQNNYCLRTFCISLLASHVTRLRLLPCGGIMFSLAQPPTSKLLNENFDSRGPQVLFGGRGVKPSTLSRGLHFLLTAAAHAGFRTFRAAQPRAITIDSCSAGQKWPKARSLREDGSSGSALVEKVFPQAKRLASAPFDKSSSSPPT